MICFHDWIYTDAFGVPIKYDGGSYYYNGVRLRKCAKCGRFEHLIISTCGQGDIQGTFWVNHNEWLRGEKEGRYYRIE